MMTRRDSETFRTDPRIVHSSSRKQQTGGPIARRRHLI